MEQYIDKTALVAWIKRRMDENRGKQTLPQYFGMIEEDLNILSFIDALEVKEMTSIELLKVKGFLVTDKDDYTAIYSTKPNRGRTEWFDGNHPRNANESSCLMTLNNARLLPDIKFNDKPIEVEVVIKAQKGE